MDRYTMEQHVSGRTARVLYGDPSFGDTGVAGARHDESSSRATVEDELRGPLGAGPNNQRRDPHVG